MISMILARLLSPDDFGLVAMVEVFINFFAIFTEMGLSDALIQKQDINDQHINSVFWLNLLFGGGLAILLFLSAPLIADFYNKPKLRIIVSILSVNLIISSFGIIQSTLLTKKMEFRKLAIRDITVVSFSGVIAIYFASHGFGVWSLVIRSIIMTLMSTALLWFVSEWRPRFIFSIASTKDIFRFGSNVASFNIVNFWARNIDNVLIGKFLGSEALGIYSLAYKLMLVPLQNVSWIISRVMFPALSEIQKDLHRVRDAYQKICTVISLITFPMMFGLFALAPELVTIVFGKKWEASIMVIRILSICGLVQSIHTTSGTILLSQGRAELQLRFGLWSSAYAAGAIAVGLNWGINGVAITYTTEQIFWILYAQNITNTVIGLKLRVFLTPLIKTFIISLTMAIGIYVFKYILSYNISIVSFISYSLVGCVLYAYLSFKLNYSEIRDLKWSLRQNVSS